MAQPRLRRSPASSEPELSSSDGRLILFPGLIILCGVLFVHGVFNSFCFVLLGVGLYLALRAQFAFFPWLIDDFQSEMAFPYELPDVGGHRDH